MRAARHAARRRARPPRRGRWRPGAASLSAGHQQVTYPAELQARVEAYLEELHFAREPATEGLDEAMRYSLLAGGKRIRPVIALATAEATGRDPGDVLPLAAAIELIHTYSLIHDDLPAMDDDELRRGRPTCHVAFGEDVAILAGDGLFAEAISLVLERQQGQPDRVLGALKHLVAAAGVGGMVGGQYIDLKHGPDFDLRHLHELKTGRLIAASVECVLELEGLSQGATIPYRRFAAELGVLFQIVDDILDVTGDEASLGKPQGSDERHGKLTYVSVHGLDRARELAAESHRSACAALAEASVAGQRTEKLEQITDYTLTRQT
ncbi:MAG: polyprenyl synthetase family protein [Thermoleophilaceae bacterium]